MKLILDQNLSLLDALTLLSPNSSKTTLRSWLKEGRVYVDESVEKVSSKLIKKNQTISIGARPDPYIQDLRVLYEDSHLIVIDKPSGLLSVTSAFEKDNTAHALLKKHFRPRKVYVVHRLDQDTSGVMLFAFSERAYEKLKAIFAEHHIVREYIAIVEGRMEQSQGKWESYLYEDENYFVHSSLNPERGRLAITHYQVIEMSKHYSLVKFTLETGRKNQIRVQCKAAGHPVLGDLKYGSSVTPVRRLCLHAQGLGFNHPINGKHMQFKSSLPQAFKKYFKNA
jgi:tRNA pseudouridine32 synthase/23S rRNA pseudouridine746 synthase/23S rRNA pseudouridine1911/1915/1917 synthase